VNHELKRLSHRIEEKLRFLEGEGEEDALYLTMWSSGPEGSGFYLFKISKTGAGTVRLGRVSPPPGIDNLGPNQEEAGDVKP